MTSKTDKRFREDVKVILPPDPLPGEALPGAQAKSPIPSRLNIVPGEVPAEAGIASPLEEKPASREFYPLAFLQSSDGLLTFVYEPVQTMVFEDANSNEVQVIYVEPDT